MSQTGLTVRDLRRSWKPHKERLRNHPTAVRFHRACSWPKRVESLDEHTEGDLVLILQWVAFNSLYGQWNEQEREPSRDCRCWKNFLSRVMAIDRGRRVAGVLQDHRPLVMSLLADKYLNRTFWQNLETAELRNFGGIQSRAQNWYLEGRWEPILERLMQQIYLLRSQLVHGAATFQGGLNRTSVDRSGQILGHLLTAFLMVWIEHGADEDWGAICYPPQHADVRVEQ